jgi:hypothetical protein
MSKAWRLTCASLAVTGARQTRRKRAKETIVATVRKESIIDVPVEQAWDALADWGALHERVAVGFVTDLQIDAGDRVITMFNGAVVRERLVTLDERERRLVWSIVGDPYEHHNASAQVRAENAARTRFVWTADFLPDELATTMDALMERGTAAVRSTLERALAGAGGRR